MSLTSKRPIVYLLKQKRGSKTYVGFTVNLRRRLRQHNGIIKGGAKKTRRNGPWKVVGYLEGFTSRQQALQAEWIWQHTRKSTKTKKLLPKRGIGKIGTLKRKLNELRIIQSVFPFLQFVKF